MKMCVPHLLSEISALFLLSQHCHHTRVTTCHHCNQHAIKHHPPPLLQKTIGSAFFTSLLLQQLCNSPDNGRKHKFFQDNRIEMVEIDFYQIDRNEPENNRNVIGEVGKQDRFCSGLSNRIFQRFKPAVGFCGF